MSFILFIIVLGILVLSHEFGHFIVAKLTGMRVDEFGFGFPPKLFGVKYGETEYTFNLIPFGGFVKIWGEDAPEGSQNLGEFHRSFVGKPRWAQVSVLVAGVAFNIILAWMFLSAGFMVGMPTSADEALGPIENPEVVITQVLTKSPAESAGLLPGDHIISLSQGSDSLSPKNADETQKFIFNHNRDAIELAYTRAGKQKTVSVTPQKLEGDTPIIGVAMDTLGVLKLPFFSAIKEGANLTYILTIETAKGLYQFAHDLIFGKNALNAVTGPVGLIGLVGTSFALGISYLFQLIAIISINLAIMNILPIPALDGGRLFFVIIEWIKGSPIKREVVNAVHTIGFIILLILMVFITGHDIFKLITG